VTSAWRSLGQQPGARVGGQAYSDPCRSVTKADGFNQTIGILREIDPKALITVWTGASRSRTSSRNCPHSSGRRTSGTGWVGWSPIGDRAASSPTVRRRFDEALERETRERIAASRSSDADTLTQGLAAGYTTPARFAPVDRLAIGRAIDAVLAAELPPPLGGPRL